jgi:hypothetical protein
VQRELKIAVAVLQQRLAETGGRLDQLELAVELDDPAAKLPKKTLVGRWFPDHFEGYVGRIDRLKGRVRKVVVPPTLAATEVYIYHVGGEARRLGPERTYVAWATGVYWALACTENECWLIVATH